ncbi:MAG: adenylate/guanylate cyclase domain-containing protein [Rhodospirillaceae bacterium]|nr:adenylate/guanylate cyclase domain-containing protein [Rhodospirillaceae bacterium]
MYNCLGAFGAGATFGLGKSKESVFREMASKEEVTFELLVMTGGTWQTHNVYSADKVNIAMGDAKSLQKISTTQSVKLVKEFYDEESGQIRQRTMFESEPPKLPEPDHLPNLTATKSEEKKPETKKVDHGFSPPRSYGVRPSAAKATQKQDTMVNSEDVKTHTSKKYSVFMIFVQIMFAIMVSLAAAIIVTTIASQTLASVTRVSMLSKDDVLVGIFILVFAIGSVTLIIRIFSRIQHAPKPIVERDDYSSAERLAEKKQKSGHHDPRLYLPSEATDNIKKSKESFAEMDLKEDTKALKEAINPSSHSKSGVGADDEEEPLPEKVIATIKQADKFVTESLKALDGTMSGVDPYAAFGVSLYMIGASHAICQENEIKPEFHKEVLGECLHAIGLASDRIDHLTARSDEYLVSDPRYLQMYQVGRSAMGIWLESGIGAQEAFAMSYENWIKPRPKQMSAPPVVVLFTDIAGSTAMTQERGDEGAQQIVREHNRIVREALSLFQGREVKHTGDGIMASFTTGVNGVEAAIDMQRKVQELSKSKPELPLQLKIGINVGEPISEDNDLFGSTVQLAARIVDKAKAGEILISEAVHGLTQGKKIPFEKHDEFEMKGFDHPIATYKVIWDEDAVKSADSKEGQKKPQVEQQDTDVPTQSIDEQSSDKQEAGESPQSQQ